MCTHLSKCIGELNERVEGGQWESIYSRFGTITEQFSCICFCFILFIALTFEYAYPILISRLCFHCFCCYWCHSSILLWNNNFYSFHIVVISSKVWSKMRCLLPQVLAFFMLLSTCKKLFCFFATKKKIQKFMNVLRNMCGMGFVCKWLFPPPTPLMWTIAYFHSIT